ELWPGEVRLDTRLEGSDVDARFGELLGQLIRRQAHAACHRGIGTVDFGAGDFQSEFLGLAHLELLVDQLVENLLARWRLVRRQLNELAALLDVERRDRLPVDDDHDLLGVRGGSQRRYSDREERGGE